MKFAKILALATLSCSAAARYVAKEKCTTSRSLTKTTLVTPIPKSSASATPAVTNLASAGTGLYITTSSNQSLVGRYAYISSDKISFTPEVARANRFNASADPRYVPGPSEGCPFDRALQAISSSTYAFADVNTVYTATGFGDATVHAWPVLFESTAAMVPNGSFVAPLVNSGTKEVWLQVQFTVAKEFITANIPQICGPGDAAFLVLSNAWLRECQNVTLGYL